jgi:hypothetical protein
MIVSFTRRLDPTGSQRTGVVDVHDADMAYVLIIYIYRACTLGFA